MANKGKYRPVHIIHLLLYAPLKNSTDYAVPIFGRTRLMKSLFIFEKEISKNFEKGCCSDFDFKPYNFGPYSRKIYEALDFLFSRRIVDNFSQELGSQINIDQEDYDIDKKFVSTEDENLNVLDKSSYENEIFKLTSKGIAMMKNKDCWFNWDYGLSKQQQDMLIEFKTTMVNSSLRDILRYVYKKYPDYAENSIIYSQLFPVEVR